MSKKRLIKIDYSFTTYITKEIEITEEEFEILKEEDSEGYELANEFLYREERKLRAENGGGRVSNYFTIKLLDTDVKYDNHDEW